MLHNDLEEMNRTILFIYRRIVHSVRYDSSDLGGDISFFACQISRNDAKGIIRFYSDHTNRRDLVVKLGFT